MANGGQSGKVWYVDNVTGNGHWMPKRYEKMPERNINWTANDEQKRKMSKGNLARGPVSEKTKRRQSAAGKTRPPTSDDTRDKISKNSIKTWAKRREVGWIDGAYKKTVGYSTKELAGMEGTTARNKAICADLRPAVEIAKDFMLSVQTIRTIKWKTNPGDNRRRQKANTIKRNEAIVADPRPAAEIANEYGLGVPTTEMIIRRAKRKARLAAKNG